jgi:hypothetical protein
MGLRRTRHRTVGRPAVKRLTLAACGLGALILLTGCSAAGGIAGAVAGAATGSVSMNPLVGYAVAVGVRAATDTAVSYVMRKRQQAEQNAIAAVIGPLPPGVVQPWEIQHDIPIGDEHGEVQVTRVIDTALADCKELVFSVARKKAPQPDDPRYVTTACHQSGGWKWAEAEPAVARWGSLQ